MKKLFSKLAIVGAVALALAVASPVEAACTSDRTFGTYPSAGTCGFYCYIATNGDNTSSSVKGFYWVLGEGSTRNSGTYAFDGTGGSQPWFIPGSPFGNGWSLTTTVNNGQTVGCPAPSPTVWVFSDSDTTNNWSLYGLSAADEDLTNFLAYDLGLGMPATNPAQFFLQVMPNLVITGAQTPASDVVLDLSWTPNGGAAFQTSSSTITDVSQVLTGWRVYKAEVARGAAAPTNLAVANWMLVDTFAGTTTGTGQVTMQCDDPSNNEVFLALAPDLDNGFRTTHYVGRPTPRVECDPNIADPNDRPKPRLIEKPKQLRQR